MFEKCPCGSGATYLACCARLHAGQADATTAEQLMRARYSAFAKGDAAYLLKSWSRETRPARLDALEARDWIGLEIEATEDLGINEASVTFTARYRVGEAEGRLRERSVFRREDGRWVYVDGHIY